MLYPLSYEGGAISLGAGPGPRSSTIAGGGMADNTRHWNAGPPFL